MLFSTKQMSKLSYSYSLGVNKRSNNVNTLAELGAVSIFCKYRITNL